MSRGMTPVLAFVGHSDSGKTQLLVRLAHVLTRRGLRVGCLKHSHHTTLDQPGSDSALLRQAGMERVAVWGGRELALFAPAPRSLADVAPLFSGMDLVLAEGFKSGPLPKVEVHRPGRRYLCRDDRSVVAVVSGTRPPRGEWFTPDEVERLADLVEGMARGGRKRRVAKNTE